VIKIYDKEVSGFDASNFVSLCRKDSLDGQTFAMKDKTTLFKYLEGILKEDPNVIDLEDIT
jgi:hypothetical protein